VGQPHGLFLIAHASSPSYHTSIFINSSVTYRIRMSAMPDLCQGCSSPPWTLTNLWMAGIQVKWRIWKMRSPIVLFSIRTW